ncbi:MAG: MBOAT family protein [Armatimonadetes bacterium]|nr:MBOAT family protein [Anaerolineae bacterium]
MDLTHITAFAAFGVGYALLLPARWRGWALYLASLVAVYWLQPTLGIRWLDYALPTAALVISALGWWLTRPADARLTRADAFALAALVGVALLLTLARYVELPFALTSRPPETLSVLLALLLVVGAAWVLGRLPATVRLWLGIAGLVILLITLKTPALATVFSALLRTQTGQDPALASPLDLEWLGVSYLAFRLIHTLRDRQSGRLSALTLREYLTYAVFFASYTAGPLDRAERFVADDRALPLLNGRDADRIARAGLRIASGLAKKFIVADSLAVISLSVTTAEQAASPLALWALLYAYAFRLLFDFSGYSDIAIGLALLCGIQLPENFNRPYLQRHIAAFWQSWHMTLGAWARAYVYAPLSRALLRRPAPLPNDAIILLCNLATMGVIGAWHGITPTFLVWGMWHGVGLTAHKLWSDRTRAWYRGLTAQPRRKRVWHVFGVLLTFHFVLLGWVWFVLPDMGLAVTVLARLFGLER